MRGTVELCHWKSGKGHVAVKVLGLKKEDDFYLSYVGKYPVWGLSSVKLIPTFLATAEEEDELVMGYNIEIDEDQPDRVPVKKDEGIIISSLDTTKIVEWKNAFFCEPGRRANYVKCNIGLILLRIFCVNCNDSLKDDHEMKYIQKSGHANCSVFAYALLRSGGLQVPDGVPRRHVVFTALLGLAGLIQLCYERPGFQPNTEVETISKYRRWIIFIFPAVTLVGATVSTIRNCIRGTVSIRTPQALVNLVNLQKDRRSFNHFRQLLGPNNCLTWFLYVLLLLTAALDTAEVLTSSDLTALDNSSFSYGVIEIAIFVSVMIGDYTLSPNESKRCSVRCRHKKTALFSTEPNSKIIPLLSVGTEKPGGTLVPE